MRTVYDAVPIDLGRVRKKKYRRNRSFFMHEYYIVAAFTEAKPHSSKPMTGDKHINHVIAVDIGCCKASATQGTDSSNVLDPCEMRSHEISSFSNTICLMAIFLNIHFSDVRSIKVEHVAITEARVC
jgi:hypothetical protein